MTPLNEENPEFDSVKDFAERSFRGAKHSVYEQTQAISIITATRSDDDLKKIRNICQAALISRKKDKLDMALVKACSKVARSFSLTLIPKDGVISIPWCFPRTKENWLKYIEPWQFLRVYYYPLSTERGREKYRSRYTKPEPFFDADKKNAELERIERISESLKKEIEDMGEGVAFYQRTTAISVGSFDSLLSEFCDWALDKLYPLVAVLSEEISPQVYQQVLEITAKLPGEKQNQT